MLLSSSEFDDGGNSLTISLVFAEQAEDAAKGRLVCFTTYWDAGS